MILVTGGTGLLGSHLLFDLLRKGYEVSCLYHKEESRESIRRLFRIYAGTDELYNKIRFIKGNILDADSIYAAMEGIETVFHCAALVSFQPKDKKDLFRINVEGTANIVDAALEKKVNKLCYVSSIAALGRANGKGIIDESCEWTKSNKNSSYAISKYKGELEVWRGIAEGLNAYIVNPSIILGVGYPAKGSLLIVNTIFKGLKFYPSGSNGYVDVRDLSSAMILLMEKNVSGERFIINSENIKYIDLFRMIALNLGISPPSIAMPYSIGSLYTGYQYLKSKIRGNQPLLTKETLNTCYQDYNYSNEKIIKYTNIKFTPVSESFAFICKIFLDSFDNN
ncbi:MAG: NAD-dependent epimerase/dehydratase family protein [Bacteroidales bacterium]|nr:NAD-dependent epimerase/dehydratase family protein [Bacteroidales bacterium]